MPTDTDHYETSVRERRTEAVAEFADHKPSPLQRVQHALHVTPALVPLIVLLASIVVFGALLGSRFFSPFALTLILQQVQIVGIVAAAQSLVILTAGIDLSVGAIMVLSSVVMGQFTFRYGIPGPVAVACGLAVGTACGFLISRRTVCTGGISSSKCAATASAMLSSSENWRSWTSAVTAAAARS